MSTQVRSKKINEIKFLDVHVSEIKNHPTAIQDMMTDRPYEGMLIREVIPENILKQIVDCLEENHQEFDPISDSKFADALKGPYGIGENIIFCDPNLQQYFNSAAIFREKWRTFLQEIFDVEERMDYFLSNLSNLPVHIPKGPQGETYIPVTIRKLPKGHEYSIHVGNEFLNKPASNHLRTLVDISNQLSFYIPLVCPEAGGELVVYGLEWDGEDIFGRADANGNYYSRFYNESHQLFHEQYGSMIFSPKAGDMVLFDGGRYYHSIVPVSGEKTRITMGGFLSLSKKHDRIYYWS